MAATVAIIIEGAIALSGSNYKSKKTIDKERKRHVR